MGSNERDDRYKKWSNFIRDGQDHAMVELHLEVNNQLIKIRRIVIQGKSPYYELKQDFDNEFKKYSAESVQKLISNLNINPDNQFAFVSQGKIDALKNLKPVELCLFLEEGIGLRSLREDILKQKEKLKLLDLNFKSMISRRNALNRSLEDILPKLKRLEQKQKLIANKKRLLDELLWANREEIRIIIDKYDNKFKSLKIKINELKTKIKSNYDLLEQIQTHMNGLETEINSTSEELGRLRYIESDLLTKIQNWEEEKLAKKEDLEKIENKILECKTNLTKLAREDNESKINVLKLIDNRNNNKSQIDELIQEQSSLGIKILNNEENYQNYEKLISQEQYFKSKIEENKGRIKDLTSDANEIFQSLQDIEEKLNHNEWFLQNPSPDLLKNFDNQITTISGKIFEKESKLKKFEHLKSKELENLKVALQSLEKRKVVIPASITILKEEIQKRDLKVKGPIIDYLKYNDELSYAIESVLGEKVLFGFIASDWQTLNQLKDLKNKFNAFCNLYLPKKSSISPLREIKSPGIIGYLSELIEVIDNDLDVKKVLYSKAGNSLVIKDYKNAQKVYEDTNFKGRCVTVKGEQLSSFKYAYETPFLRKLKGFLSSATLKEQINLIKKNIENLDKIISHLKSILTKHDNNLKEIYNKKDLFNDLFYNFNQKNRLNQRRNEIYEKIYALENQNSKIKVDLNDNTTQLEKLNAQIEPTYRNWKERIVEISNLIDEKNTKLKKLEVEISKVEKLRSKLEAEEFTYKTELSRLEDVYKLKKEDFEKTDKKNFSIFNDLAKIKEEIIFIKDKLKRKQEIKEKELEEKKKLETTQNELKIELGQDNFSLNILEGKIESKKLELKRIEKELGKKALDSELKVREIDEIKQDLYDVEKELIGYIDVDETLLIEKEEILSSLNELGETQKVLEEDINSAIKLENKMEETYFSKFNSELKKLEVSINDKFRSSGIKNYCSLELKGEFEVLGIEVKAAMSMSQLKLCTALSGGQISMISICLILSLQEIKPSPLCMFDEAAMFLDEKNAEVSYELIKSTLKGSDNQLILFLPSSSKALFSLADKIIGVARTGKEEISTIFNPKIITEWN